MAYEDDVIQWLQELPVGTPVEIDGETVYLETHPDGAVLGGYLMSAYTPAQLQNALKLGFQNALFYKAGLGQSRDGNTLVLTQWLPKARSWLDAADELEELLNQLSEWRETLVPARESRPVHASEADRNEQRLRKLFAGVQK